jgi:hypothetical protein
MTKFIATPRLGRTEGPISDMEYHKVGTWPLDKPLPVRNPPWIEPQAPAADANGEPPPTRSEPLGDAGVVKVGVYRLRWGRRRP